MVKCAILGVTGPHEFVTGNEGLQFENADGLSLHIFVDGPNGESLDLDIPIGEARRDLKLMLMLLGEG